MVDGDTSAIHVDCDEGSEYIISEDEHEDWGSVQVEKEMDNPSSLNCRLKPQIGMEFVLEEEAYNHYNLYAKLVGFSIRRSHFYRSRKIGCITVRTIVCSKEGEK